MKEALGVSERRVCRVLGQHRSTQRKLPCGADDEHALTEDIVALARQYGRYGYRRATALLHAAGWSVNHKRVERIWRREGLKVPQRQPKRGRLWLNDGSCIRLRPEYPGHVWAYDSGRQWRRRRQCTNTHRGPPGGGCSRITMVLRPEIQLTVEQKRILSRLRTSGPAPRTVLASELGMHNAAMTRIARELITLGIIDEGDADGRALRGRPTVPLTISGRAGYAVGAAVHPGWLEIALVDFAGNILARDSEAFNSPDPSQFVVAVNRRLHALAMTGGVLRSRCLGLGIAATGPMIAQDPNIRWAVPWLEGWRDVHLQPYFAERFDLTVHVENDATLAALAEYYQGGLIRQSKSALVFFIGHGVGGGLIIDRAPLRGERGNAAEIGRLFPNGRPRPSGIDLLSHLREHGVELSSLRDVTKVLKTQQGVIAGWIDRAARQLEIAVEAGIAWLDPGAIVLSGAVPDPILRALGDRLAVAEWTRHDTHLPRPSFHVSDLGSWAVAVGAALLPIHEIGQAS